MLLSRERIALVRKMPVDCAARNAGFQRDVGQCGARNAFIEKHPLCRIENTIARLRRFFLGSSDHYFVGSS